MVTLIDLLPLVQGWESISIRETKSLEAEDSDILYQSEGNDKGWILGMKMSSNTSDSSVSLQYNPAETGQVIEIDLNPDKLMTLGYITPSRLGPHIETYDPANSMFSAAWIPQVPFPFDGELLIKVTAGSSDSKINYDIEIIRITDIDMFVNSLRMLIAPPQPAPSQRPTTEEVIGRYTGFLP